MTEYYFTNEFITLCWDIKNLDDKVFELNSPRAQKLIRDTMKLADEGEEISDRLFYATVGTMYHFGILQPNGRGYTFNEYEVEAMKTSKFTDEAGHSKYGVLNIASEAGEIAGKYAKAFRDKELLDEGQVAKEIGDLLWSIACLVESLDYSMEDIAKMNIKKLADRDNRDMISGSGDNR